MRTIGLAVVARERGFKLIGGGSGKCGRMSKDGGGEGEVREERGKDREFRIGESMEEEGRGQEGKG